MASVALRFFIHHEPSETMSDKTKIEWTDATWNPIRGCTAVSPGCANCYAAAVAARFSGEGQPYEGLAKHAAGAKPKWTNEILVVERVMTQPLRWRRPRKVFVNSMSDLFHKRVLQDVIDATFAVMALSGQHVFQVLTKRADRMREYLTDDGLEDRIYERMERIAESEGIADFLFDGLPIDNAWLGVSVEGQDQVSRVDELLGTPAAIRFISAEPLLGPLTFQHYICEDEHGNVGLEQCGDFERPASSGIDWVIVGGESGPHARPMHPDWVRDIRDQCQAAGVSFFFKQWGEWSPNAWGGAYGMKPKTILTIDGHQSDNPRRWGPEDRAVRMTRVGKKAAGRLLDGREWSEYPQN